MNNMLKYVKFNDQYIKLHEGNFDKYSVIKGEAYRVDGEIFIYRGIYDENKSTEIGLYLDGDDFIVNGDSEISESCVMEQDTSTSRLLNNIRSMSNKQNISQSSSSKDDDETAKTKKNKTPKKEEKRKLGSNRRMKRDQPLHFNIQQEDDPMVRVIKEKINSKSFTMEDIYNAVENETAGYNLFYGLSIRPNMNWKTFSTWCDILGVEPILSIRDKD